MEWLTLLLGESYRNGLYVKVDGLYTPKEQYRDGGNCDIDESKFPFPDWVKRRLVGVVHSHHTMSANFSGPDLAENGFCFRYPVSIVISSSMPYGANNASFQKECKLLGFSYEAVMRHRMGCGAFGKSHASIIPTGMRDWPFGQTIHYSPTNLEVKDLGDCKRYSEGVGSSLFELVRVGNCGCKETEVQTKYSIFDVPDGEVEAEILDHLPKYERPPIVHYRAGEIVRKHSDYHRDEYNDDEPTAEEWERWLKQRNDGHEVVRHSEALVRVTD